METVTITKSEYDQLRSDSATLAALRAGGVENWEWYEDALENFLDE